VVINLFGQFKRDVFSRIPRQKDLLAILAVFVKEWNQGSAF